MKKNILLIALFVFGLVETKAQCNITNADLETWSGSPETATDWLSINDLSRGSSPSVTKSTSAQHGTYAASLVLGPSISGKYSDFLYANKNCTQKPISFSGYYTFSPSAGDSLLLIIAVSSSPIFALSDTANAAGYGALLITNTTSAYTSFTVPVNYRSTSATSYISLGALIVKHSTATSALLDNFSILYPATTATTEAKNTQISLLTDFNKEEISFSNIQERATLEIYNMAGMKVAEKTLTEADALLNISTFRSGLYMAKVSMNDTQTTLKFFK
jgi:hypothetical protein